MPVWPKSILHLGANLLTARTAVRLRRRDRATRVQQAAYQCLVRHFAATSFWRETGVRAGMPYAEFRRAIGPRTPAALAPAVQRMQQGEADVLWPGRCSYFATSAGMTSGHPHLVPVTAPMLRHFRTGGRDALLYYTARTGHTAIFRGAHLFLTGSTALAEVPGTGGHRAYVGEWPAIAALNQPRWTRAEAYEPQADIAAMTDWAAKMNAIIAATAGRDISLLGGMPAWTLAFAEALRAQRAEAGQPIENLQEIWPNLECYLHGGTPLGPYQPELRAVLGDHVRFHEVYAAAEGMLAAQDTAAAGEMRLMANLGLFFEFLPLAEFDEQRLDAIGDRAVPLAEVQPGIDYVLLVTTPAGLARCVIGDIVRFTSVEPPRIVYTGRTDQQLAAFGERVLEKDITDALVAVCGRHRWTIVNFHVAPHFDFDRTGQARGRHEWWVELKPGTVETPRGPQMAVELDAELQRISADYAQRRKSGRIDEPMVRLVMPGVFQHWMRFHGKIGAQHKVARTHGDRLIADEFAQITKFHD